MSRNLYILGATLLLLSLASCGLAYTRIAHEPGSPGDVALWRIIGLTLMLFALISGVAGTMTAMFEQSARRNEERAQRDRQRER